MNNLDEALKLPQWFPNYKFFYSEAEMLATFSAT